MSVQRRKLINHPDNLIEELIAGMVSAHPDHLFVSGDTGRAIVAKNGPRHGKVGIVVGGGSGHEPAFAGYVGHGLADAAPLGNIFASPSPSQIMDAGFAADGGAGVLFLYGNYTGDVMNFGMAAEGMAKEGITARSFVVTDDIASAPLDNIEERRGIAGDFFVFKVAGAAADLGLDMEAVEAAAKRANDATRTMGVALGPCTMPQTGQANFELPPGEMEIGMGIHGEPGIERGPAETADAVTDRLLAPILQELDLRAQDRVAVLVNGLGSTSLLELYILHNRVAQIMAERSVDIHASWVGEYCTSLDMEGASITIMKLDGDLQSWLDHPCDTPALRVGAAAAPAAHPAREMQSRSKQRGRVTVALDDLKSDGPITPGVFHTMMEASAQAIYRERDRLSALDGAIGDGDHGLTMEIGWKAVMARLNAPDRPATISAMCEDMADAFLEAVGASAGPLYGSAFQTAGAAVADRLNLDAASYVAWVQGLSDGIVARGGAQPGDKTMVDAWGPAAAAAKAKLRESSAVADCAVAAAQAASAGAVETKQMLSNRGRSKKLGERSRGHIDPGAESAAVMLQAWAQVLADLEKS
ncbi:dihydroxyacetone kinase subunit DhaL [Roseobacter litoralis]|uniref:dihydroxyacetone kinase subunit DhaL n=1 Tax=Roseobacter litoralis TaxID=42443 RepID=UPI002493BD39|nr:dihydroxyacetone kinase subunit DhaL [Roseobacter litoralis]